MSDVAEGGAAKLVSPDGRERLIPAEIFDVVEQVANTLAAGNGWP
ncbi:MULTISPECIES: hypothetical protein [unclassified Curtobacterium]|nr:MULTISPECIES: hypothetical protein [unclassified Curtobacterium]